MSNRPRPPVDRDAARRAMLRGFCFVSGGLALAIAVLGFSPGYELYRLGKLQATAAVANAPHGLAAVAAILVALIAYVWRRPSLANALLASMASVGVSVFVLALTAAPRVEPAGPGLGPGPELLVELPAATVTGQLVLSLVVVQLVLLPAACAVLARTARGAWTSEGLARAHVHRIGQK
ncbi:MAG TPA: hypothetical protein VNO30_38980 [Kofleriaceae bacterium]|nr:hypothetical protein [Kofleriaceae bacterium]